MIRKTIFASMLLSASFLMTSCGETHTEEKHDTKEELPKVSDETIPKYKVYKADIAKEYADAELMLGSGGEGHWEPNGMETADGKIKEEFNYSIKNYELAKPTEGEADRHCAVSNKGQHIHFIVNNGPYQAMYEPQFSAELNKGTNIILSFLSRSYHESIKNGKAYDITKVSYGSENSELDKVDITKDPMLFYSRPKGTYKGADAEKLLLDFYLVNAELSDSGYKVKAIINGEEHILDSWAPYFVEGLPAGENTFQIQLIDAEGNLVEGPFNDSKERVITLEKEEAHGEHDGHGHH